MAGRFWPSTITSIRVLSPACLKTRRKSFTGIARCSFLTPLPYSSAGIMPCLRSFTTSLPNCSLFWTTNSIGLNSSPFHLFLQEPVKQLQFVFKHFFHLFNGAGHELIGSHFVRVVFECRFHALAPGETELGADMNNNHTGVNRGQKIDIGIPGTAVE